MKNCLRAIILIAFSLLSIQSYAQYPLLGKMDGKYDVRKVADAMVEKFIATPPTRFGNPHLEAPKNLTYPDVCAYLGALWYARNTDNESQKKALADKFLNMLKEKPSMQQKHTNVDANVFGSVPLELFIQKLADWKSYTMGLSYADSQWTLPKNAKDQQKKYAEQGYSWQTRIWIDDMFMITTIQTQAYRATGNRKYIERAAREMVMYLEAIQQPNGLFHHSATAPHFWARGNGWMAAGMAELLYNLPKTDPNYDRIMVAYRKMMATLLKYQGKDGLWHQLIDKEDAWSETSSSAMFSYGMLCGVKRGWLPKGKYKKAIRAAWKGLVDQIDTNGEILNVCEGTNAKDDEPYYYKRKRISGDHHAHAPFLWFASELVK